MFGDKFDLIAWLSAEPDFVSIWSNYKPIGRIRNYDLYEFEVSLSRGLTIRLSRYWLPADLNSRGFFGIDASEGPGLRRWIKPQLTRLVAEALDGEMVL
jgi:hypothetical protein